jgi:hypothetical protein
LKRQHLLVYSRWSTDDGNPDGRCATTVWELTLVIGVSDSAQMAAPAAQVCAPAGPAGLETLASKIAAETTGPVLPDPGLGRK